MGWLVGGFVYLVSKDWIVNEASGGMAIAHFLFIIFIWQPPKTCVDTYTRTYLVGPHTHPPTYLIRRRVLNHRRAAPRRVGGRLIGQGYGDGEGDDGRGGTPGGGEGGLLAVHIHVGGGGGGWGGGCGGGGGASG